MALRLFLNLNCFTAGDLVCDTAADPQLIAGTNVNAFCVYTETDGYNPPTRNIMSYSFDICRDEFTNGQGWRMRQAILNNSTLQPLVNGSCSISDINWEYNNDAAVCLSQNKTFELTNVPSTMSVAWSVTSNLNIVSSTYDSITVVLNNLNTEDTIITGTLVINGLTYIFTLELDQLSIPSSSNLTLESFKSEPIYTDRWTNITAKYNSFIDVGQLGYTWEWIVPSHQIRYVGDNYSYIHVNPLVQMSSVYIKVRACNECGDSDWYGQWFTVEDPPGGCTSCPTGGGEVHY